LKKKREKAVAELNNQGIRISKNEININILKWIEENSVDGYYQIPMIPAIYLLKKGYLKIYEGGEEVSLEKLLSIASKKDRHVLAKLIVFENLIRRGYYVRNIDEGVMEVYSSVAGKKKYNLIVIDEGHSIDIDKIYELTKTSEIIIAIVERRGGITYYATSQFGRGE